MTEPIKVSVASLRSDLIDIVAMKGFDHRYGRNPAGGASCQYWHDETPGCIFGHWFALKGLDRAATIACDVSNEGMGIHEALTNLQAPHARIRLDSSFGEFLSGDELDSGYPFVSCYAGVVQAEQDSGEPDDNGHLVRPTWGEALVRGDKWLRERLPAAELERNVGIRAELLPQ